MDYPKLEELNSSNCTERSILKHYPEFWKHIIDNYHHSELWTERLYWFYYKLDDFPKCKKCGKPTKFVNIKTGYREFCSTKCMNSYGDIQERKKLTSIKNWGTDNPMKSKKVKDKLKKSTKEKYGVENVFELEETKQKIKQTNLNKYGAEYYLSTKECRDKIKRTCLERYGVECISQREDYKKQIKKTFFEKYGGVGNESHVLLNKYINTVREKFISKKEFLIGYTQEGDWICKCPHKSCNKCDEKYYITKQLIYYNRHRENIELCTKLLPINKDYSKNTSLELFVKDILDKYDVKYKTNVRYVLKQKELDIYIPSLNIAIECNGIYWHSSLEKPNSYHINKTKLCKEKDIQLIHIWEDWIKTKPDIIESIITNKLGLNNDNIIYARKCEIKEVNPSICNDFLHNNHIQGRSSSTIRLGLYYNDELVSIMTFSPPRVNMGAKNHKQQWELVRFCNKLNTRVVGGASKLLSHFIKSYNPTSIVSFSMNDISDGNLYKKLGFESNGIISSSYWYIEPKTYKRYHRTSFSKQAIVKKGWKDKVDNTWTEKDVMLERGYYRIYDSGQMKWVLNLS